MLCNFNATMPGPYIRLADDVLSEIVVDCDCGLWLTAGRFVLWMAFFQIMNEQMKLRRMGPGVRLVAQKYPAVVNV